MKLFGDNLESVYREHGGDMALDKVDKYPWHKVAWEENLWNDHGTYARFLYNSHIDRIKKSGYSRSATPQEYYSFAIGALEHAVFMDNDLENVAEEMRTLKEPEYFCHAAQKIGVMLRVYTNVDGVEWSPGSRQYITTKSNWYDEIEEYDMSLVLDGDSSVMGQFLSMEFVKGYYPEYVKHFFGRDYDELPDEIKFGKWVLPDDDGLHLMGRGFSVGDICFNVDMACSRGVIPK